MTPRRPFLERLGLHRPELRAWAMYDWANSAMVLIIVTAVFPIFFATFAAATLPPATATARYAMATTLGLTVAAFLAPVLGAFADTFPVKKRLLAAFVVVGSLASAAMFFIGRGEWILAAVLFVVANIAANASYVAYDSLLPHVARADEMDRVSTAGYALGYLGSGLLLTLCLLWIQKPGWFGFPTGEGLSPAASTLPVRLSFVAVGVWWMVFTIPLLRRVREPEVLAASEDARRRPVRASLARLAHTIRELRGYRQALLMLVAFLIYNDGIGTIIRMAAIYGTELGIGRSQLIGAILLVQFVGIPFAFLFGMVASRIGARTSIFIGLGAYCVISIFGYFVTTARDFLVLATLVGMVQGGTQALSRSLFATMIPRHKSGEFFGLFAVFEKFAGILGPLIFGITVALTGTSRAAILSVIVFFVVGGMLLARVDVEEGEREARKGEADLEAASAGGIRLGQGGLAQNA